MSNIYNVKLACFVCILLRGGHRLASWLQLGGGLPITLIVVFLTAVCCSCFFIETFSV